MTQHYGLLLTQCWQREKVGVELDTHRWKVGDGTTAWNSLGYATDLELLPIIGSRTEQLCTNGTVQD